MTDMRQLFQAACKAANEAQDQAIKDGKDVFAMNCGFAWVIVRPARGPFITWCKAQAKDLRNSCFPDVRHSAINYGDNAHGGGWQFWSPGDYMGQIVDVKMAGAEAFAKVLREAGLEAHAGSRLD